jgi:UDP-N-acetyl-D-glucosamine/UDP-N-acetyl-D-galactosamine dehydrogenase
MLDKINDRTAVIGIIGLGYVGLPLAVEFGRKFDTVGFDINKTRVDELKKGYDRTLEVDEQLLKSAQKLSYSTDISALEKVDIFIVTVPTPIDKYKRPDLTPLIKASQTVGKVLKSGNIVIYESTVYPGCTEEDCVPVMEHASGLKFNKDFFCGYSPERINPGDKLHTVTKIKKVTSGSNPQTALAVDALYKTIITAGTHLAPSMKVAEAAKVIENSQRDINIAFVNELSKIFHLLGIDTMDVLEAAGTKWNFLPFRPGLVGGHCIGVDPYYLTHKAQSLGYHPEIILAGRRLNDDMGRYAAGEIVKLMIKKGHRVQNSKVLILGITFKENCPDIRNSRVIDVINELKDYGCDIDVYDPWADADEVKHEYGIELIDRLNGQLETHYDTVVLAVAHDKFKDLKLNTKNNSNIVLYDIKSVLDKTIVDGRL